MTKTIINHRFRLENYFPEILYMIDVWNNNGSGRNVESIEFQYINNSTYRLLSESFYMDLPAELKNSRKGLLNIKNKDQKSFLWCHGRYINPSKEHPERILKTDKRYAEKLDYDRIEFPVQEKLKQKTIYTLTYLVMEMGWFFQFIFQIKNLKTQWICCFQLMMINHIMCTSKILTDICFAKQKIKTKNGFVEVVYSILVAKMC